MKRGSRFLAGFAAAGLTFGALMATLGPAQFNKYGHQHCYSGYYHQHCAHEHSCEAPEQK